MNKNRFAKPVAVAAGFIFLLAAPGLVRTQSTPSGAVQTPTPASPGAQPFPEDDFAGLSFTDEQKTEIDKIRRDTASRKEVVAKDEKLTSDQKDAMILGYTRLEYSSIFKVLSPEQQRQVRQKIRARKAADPATQSKQSPRN
jgi:hypothetical protein